MNILKMSGYNHSRVWSHLLPENSCKEQAAFLFCRTTEVNGGVIFEVVDQALLGKDDFASQFQDYIELRDDARIDLIKRAYKTGTSLAELHSHPGPFPAAFSISDRTGLQETVPHMRWRLNKRPYLAIVVAPSGFDALVWVQDGRAPEPLGGIDIEGTLMKPTNNSLGGWCGV